ncbi:hypothetical protein [Rossellomorea sp. DA94]|nr:hypothetical protein [Rossellomorea sp. DA94]WGG46746.1 hypothetical protein P8596_05880 [Rossellomorea sp. DA94]
MGRVTKSSFPFHSLKTKVLLYNREKLHGISVQIAHSPLDPGYQDETEKKEGSTLADAAFLIIPYTGL